MASRGPSGAKRNSVGNQKVGAATSAKARTTSTPGVQQTQPTSVNVPAPVQAEDASDTMRIKVVVRCRPQNAKEQDDPVIVGPHPVNANGVVLEVSKRAKQPTAEAKSSKSMQKAKAGKEGEESGSVSFVYDKCLFSDATQEQMYDTVGKDMLCNFLDGYNGCFFAYGQTGSGKSHSVTGGASPADKGVLPRFCEGMFRQVQESPEKQFNICVAYLEIYNERARDLLRPHGKKESSENLEIRQHPKFGVFVPNLTENVVTSVSDVEGLLDFGNKIRVVGCTNMNAVSSRSHAIFTISCQQSIKLEDEEKTLQSRMHMVDLAGSERQKQANSSDKRLQEGAAINKSLSCLGMVISKLAEAETKRRPSSSAAEHIPFRNTKLTYLLSDSLMGNSRTVMLATISPSKSNEVSTESTLRFASSVKQIKTKPKRNEESSKEVIDSLKAEIESLKAALANGYSDELRAKLLANEQLTSMIGTSWEERAARTAEMNDERGAMLCDLGLSTQQLQDAWKSGASVVVRKDADPYLVNTCDDPLLSGCLMYTLPRGKEVLAGSDADKCTIQIDGLGIHPVMCRFLNHDGKEVTVSLGEQGSPATDTHGSRSDSRSGLGTRQDGRSATRAGLSRASGMFKLNFVQVFVNGDMMQKETRTLHDKDRMLLGRTHAFQIFIPQQLIEDDANDGEGEESMLTDPQDPDSPVRKAQAANKCNDLLGEILGNTESQEYHKGVEFMSFMKQRLGEDRTIKLLEGWTKIQPLIEEANDITMELRGDEDVELAFHPKFSCAMLGPTREDGDLDILVQLVATELPEDIGSFGVLKYAKLHSNENGSLETTALATWTSKDFERTVEALRDLYAEVSERDEPWNADIDGNPWSSGPSPGKSKQASEPENEQKAREVNSSLEKDLGYVPDHRIEQLEGQVRLLGKINMELVDKNGMLRAEVTRLQGHREELEVRLTALEENSHTEVTEVTEVTETFIQTESMDEPHGEPVHNEFAGSSHINEVVAKVDSLKVEVQKRRGVLEGEVSRLRSEVGRLQEKFETLKDGPIPSTANPASERDGLGPPTSAAALEQQIVTTALEKQLRNMKSSIEKLGPSSPRSTHSRGSSPSAIQRLHHPPSPPMPARVVNYHPPAKNGSYGYPQSATMTSPVPVHPGQMRMPPGPATGGARMIQGKYIHPAHIVQSVQRQGARSPVGMQRPPVHAGQPTPMFHQVRSSSPVNQMGVSALTSSCSTPLLPHMQTILVTQVAPRFEDEDVSLDSSSNRIIVTEGLKETAAFVHDLPLPNHY